MMTPRRSSRPTQSLPVAVAVSILSLTLLAQAQDPVVGDTVARAGSAGYRRNAEENQLQFGDEVERDDFLVTHLNGRLAVLLIDGQRVSLSEEAEVHLEQNRADLRRGTIRVVASPGFLVQTPGAKAEADATSFLVSYGAPAAADGTSLVVGIYGLTRVTSVAAPLQPVELQPRYFTLVRPGEAPDPPKRIDDRRYFELLDSTTIVGSGSKADRIELGMEHAPAPSPFDVTILVPAFSLTDVMMDIPVDPQPTRIDRGPGGFLDPDR